jgi:phosphoglucosamine mutase
MRLFSSLPQLLRSARFNGSTPLERVSVKAAIREAEALLGRQGRLLIRKSGTEPVIRVMAEGEDGALVGRAVEAVVHAIEQSAGS